MENFMRGAVKSKYVGTLFSLLNFSSSNRSNFLNDAYLKSSTLISKLATASLVANNF